MQLIMLAPPYLAMLAVRFPWCLCYRKLDELARKEKRYEEPPSCKKKKKSKKSKKKRKREAENVSGESSLCVAK